MKFTPNWEFHTSKRSCVAEAGGRFAEAFRGSENQKHQTISCVAEGCGRVFAEAKNSDVEKLMCCGSEFAEAELVNKQCPLNFCNSPYIFIYNYMYKVRNFKFKRSK